MKQPAATINHAPKILNSKYPYKPEPTQGPFAKKGGVSEVKTGSFNQAKTYSKLKITIQDLFFAIGHCNPKGKSVFQKDSSLKIGHSKRAVVIANPKPLGLGAKQPCRL